MTIRRRGLRRILVLLAALSSFTAAAQAATFTVGVAGTHATIQAAIDAAISAGGDNEVRVRQGTFAERLVVPGTFSGGLTVTGGWDASFGSRNPSPALTVIDAGGLGRGLTIDGVDEGSLRFEGLTFTGGVEETGGGVYVTLNGDAELALVDNRIVDNVATGTNAEGGGLWVNLVATSHLTLDGNLLSDNLAQGDAIPQGGGFFLRSSQDSTFSIRGNQIEGNRAVSSDEQGRSAGFGLLCSFAGSGEIADNVVRDNEAVGVGQSFGYGASITFLRAGGVLPSGIITARRNLFLDNQYADASAFADHLSLNVDGSAQLLLSDSVIAGGNRNGPGVSFAEGGTIRLTNVTIAGHGAIGIFDYRLVGLPTVGTFSLFNAIVFGNGTETDLSAFVQTGSNLVGTDPLFASAVSGDYHLLAASPAIDAGTNTPPGGLGATDVDGLSRIAGGTVDIGAYERQLSTGPDCTVSDTALCLAGDRFRVELGWETATNAGVGHGVELTGDTGYFWFFNAANVEVVVKVLNACSTFDRFWVFAAGLTNVAVEIVVTDTATGAVRTYENPRGTAFAPLQDTAAFATCP